MREMACETFQWDDCGLKSALERTRVKATQHVQVTCTAPTSCGPALDVNDRGRATVACWKRQPREHLVYNYVVKSPDRLADNI